MKDVEDGVTLRLEVDGETQATASNGAVVTTSKKRKKQRPSKKAPSKKAKPAAEARVSVPDDSSESEDDELSEAAQYERQASMLSSFKAMLWVERSLSVGRDCRMSTINNMDSMKMREGTSPGGKRPHPPHPLSHGLCMKNARLVYIAKCHKISRL